MRRACCFFRFGKDGPDKPPLVAVERNGGLSQTSPRIEHLAPCAPAAPDVRRGAPLLAEARVHQLRRADWTDRDHAPGAGREEALDQRGPLSPRAQLLHAFTRARGAATRDVHRLA